ncbi:hypothetical protein WMY93_002727 [Mugilogobius chulae]|uniref:BZIP domain-containing protein n=1 Tax=Mugilogobius chulae TaxID=88201 RepID=A0AAW0PUJ7_9GOBI
MPGKAAVTVAIKPSSPASTAGSQKSFPFALKKIMDIPPPNILEEGDDEIEKEKLGSSEDVEGGLAAGATAGGASRGSGGGGGSGGVSASLTPAIWDKTIPYDGETFHLEYMDLDEFLLENGIPVSLEEEELQKTLGGGESKGKTVPKVTATISLSTDAAATTTAVVPTSVESPTSEDTSEPEEPITVTTLQPAKIEEEEEEDDDTQEQEEELPNEPEIKKPAEVKEKKKAIEVDINFQPDPTDLVLSSVPGGELFNPRKHRFSDEDLKPQPMIKKAKKVFVPDEQKDEKYWSRRKKNNLAAKRSRDARRLKENQITVRASFLERGECCSATASGRAPKGLWSLQKHPGPLRGQVWAAVELLEKYQ